MSELPFQAEYARSGRAGCKSCGKLIGKDSLRLAVMVQVRSIIYVVKLIDYFIC